MVNMSTEADLAASHLENVALSVFYILVFAVAVPGNALALWAYWGQECTSPFRLYLRHLAVADMSFVLILPMRIVYHLAGNRWPFGHFMCNLSGFLFFVNVYWSVGLISLISLDRCLAVVLPSKSAAVRKLKYSKAAVAVAWVVVLIAMGPALLSGTTESGDDGTCIMLYLERYASMALGFALLGFSFPLVSVVVSYTLILLKLRGVKLQGQQAVAKGRVAVLIILLQAGCFLAFVPYFVTRLICIVVNLRGVKESAEGLDLLLRACRITSALTCVSGILHPVMFFFLNPMYREKLSQILHMKRGPTTPAT